MDEMHYSYFHKNPTLSQYNKTTIVNILFEMSFVFRPLQQKHEIRPSEINGIATKNTHG